MHHNNLIHGRLFTFIAFCSCALPLVASSSSSFRVSFACSDVFPWRLVEPLALANYPSANAHNCYIPLSLPSLFKILWPFAMTPILGNVPADLLLKRSYFIRCLFTCQALCLICLRCFPLLFIFFACCCCCFSRHLFFVSSYACCFL